MRENVVFESIYLTDEERRQLSATLAECHRCLKAAAFENFGGDRVKRLRDWFKSGKLTLRYNPAARNAMQTLMGLEGRVIAAYMRLASKLCLAFHRSHTELWPDVSFQDYLQEARLALYDATYTYDGSTEFTTYSHWCVKNQLISLVRRQQSGIGITKSLAAKRTLVRRAMKNLDADVDVAIDSLVSGGVLAVEERRAVRRTVVRDDHNLSEIEMKGVAVTDRPYDEETRLMLEAVERTELSPLERELVQAHLEGRKEFRRVVSETRINPNTGNLYTKAVLSNIFLAACEKLNKTYESMRRRAA